MQSKKGRSRFRYALFVFLLLLITTEVTFRVLGHRPWQPHRSSIERIGGGPLFERDSLLGYRNLPGIHPIRVNGKINCTVTHTAEGHRITAPPDSTCGPFKVWVLGCSFTHGYGVEDAESFPWLLQQRLRSFEVTNFGTDGYGPHQCLMQVRRQLALGDTADLVILCYAGFHDQRVVCSPFWQKAISGQQSLRDWEYPYQREGRPGKMTLNYSPFYPGIRWSAFLSAMDNRACAREEATLNAADETEAVIRELDQVVSQTGRKLIVAGIWRHPDTEAMLARLEDIQHVDASPDPSLTILPDDLHPNAAGHIQIANAIYDFLQVTAQTK